MGWLATLVLAVCCALRLARFNLSLGTSNVPLKKDDFFVGVPAPALACLALLPVFMLLYGWPVADYPLLRTVYIIGVGLLAISTIPTFSIKHASIKQKHLAATIVVAVMLVVSLMVYPWPTLITANLMYMASLPFSYLSHKKHLAKSG